MPLRVYFESVVFRSQRHECRYYFVHAAEIARSLCFTAGSRVQSSFGFAFGTRKSCSRLFVWGTARTANFVPLSHLIVLFWVLLEEETLFLLFMFQVYAPKHLTMKLKVQRDALKRSSPTGKKDTAAASQRPFQKCSFMVLLLNHMDCSVSLIGISRVAVFSILSCSGVEK